MPSTRNTSITSCYGKSKNRTLSENEEEKKIFKTKVDILNCKPEDVKLKMEGNRVIIEGTLYKKNKEKPVYFSKHYIMPENCELDKMRYTITPDGVHITAPRKSDDCNTEWPKLEEDCTNCIDLKDRFEIRQNVKEFRPDDINIKVNGNTITIKAKKLQETGMKRVVKTYSLPENCEITKLERIFTPQGHLILSIPKFLGLFYKSKSNTPNNEKSKNVKCKFNITNEKFEIKMDVFDFKPEDINIIQQKHMIIIEGKRFKKNIEEKFEKTFVVPSDYDIGKIDRQFNPDGILIVSVPRIKGKSREDFKTLLPENSVCDMKIKDDYVEIKLDIVGFSPEEITIKVIGKQTITLEGKQIGGKGRINKSFMKSYILPSECDTKKIKKHITTDGILIIRVPKSKRTSSLDNLSDLTDQKIFSNGNKNGSVDNLSEPDTQPMVDSAELNKNKFEMKFNVQGFQTEDIYVKINKNIVTIECKHPHPEKGIIKSYLVPSAFNLNALQTFITNEDILVVTIPRISSSDITILDNDINRISSDRTNISKDEYRNDKTGNTYIIKVDIKGYNHNDVSLDIKGQNVIVQGGLLGNKTLSRSFSKNFSVPSNYDVENLIYYISADGFLIVEVPKKLNNETSQKLYTFPNEMDNENDHVKSPIVPKNYIEHKQHLLNQYNNRKNYNTFPKSIKQIEKPSRKIHQTDRSTKGEVIFDGEMEYFHLKVDLKDCNKDKIDVRVKDNTVKILGEDNNFIRNFIVPNEFYVKGIKTKFENDLLHINIPKYNTMEENTTEISPKVKDILSNVKIGQENIVVEMDASGLVIEDFEITTLKNILTIEVSKGNLNDEKFKTKIDLPEDAIIDEIMKQISKDGKLLVKVPRKFIKNETDPYILDEIVENKRKSCLIPSKSTMGEKSKSVKFLVDDFDNESNDFVKFATLPRSSRSKSYNCLTFDDMAANLTRNLNENFELKIFVPHHEPEEVIVKLRGNTITIEGKKNDDKGNSYFGKNFFKTYIVPKNIDTEQLKTTFDDNYLIITAPRKE